MPCSRPARRWLTQRCADRRPCPQCLSRHIIRTDELLFAGELGKVAMTCGTTSTVCYMHGPDIWTACSGDSRAVKGARKDGCVVAHDLCHDHKPDLPEERARIVARGGTVTDGGAGRPSRVWAHGRIGLAMSRSIGDGECKGVGVIPDPEISHFVLQPPADAHSDGDLFVIVASDGIWEFIESAEACELVVKHKTATDACTALVHEAAARWKRFEGSYRDDITAIVAFLPFLEAGWADEDAEEALAAAASSSPAAADEADGGTSTSHVFLNVGKEGLSYSDGGVPSVAEEASEQEGGADEGGGEEAGEEFVARRLSVHNPYDDDWNEVGEGADDDDDDDDDGGAAPAAAK